MGEPLDKDAEHVQGAEPAALVEFRFLYAPPQEPQIVPTESEKVMLTEADGMRALPYAPIGSVRFGQPPRGRGDPTLRYLWVITEDGIPYIVEQPLPRLAGQLPKHTNLTGGQPAYIGGEIWFKDSDTLFLSGGSGRYPPKNFEQLNDAVRVFQAYRYNVNSLGWDPETGAPERVLKEV